MRAAAFVCLLALACSDRGHKKPEEAELPRRVLRPAPERVLAIAPHNLHRSGMGPYKLGDDLKTVLGLLPEGPRVELFGITNVFNYSLVRAENGKLLLGVDNPGGVEFVAALSADVAKGEHGIGVGSTRGDLEATMGIVDQSTTLVNDPRILTFRKAPDTRFILDNDIVQAVIVGATLDHALAAPLSCRSHDLPLTEAQTILRLPVVDVVPLCAGGKASAIAWKDARLNLLVVEGERWRRAGAATIPGLVFAAPLDIDGNGSQEVVAVSQEYSPTHLIAEVKIMAFDGGRWDSVLDLQAYRISAESLEWLGTRLDQIKLLLTVSVANGRVWVGGLFLQVDDNGLKNLVPLKRRDVSSPLPRARKNP